MQTIKRIDLYREASPTKFRQDLEKLLGGILSTPDAWKVERLIADAMDHAVDACGVRIEEADPRQLEIPVTP